jgi:hypothetical protein
MAKYLAEEIRYGSVVKPEKKIIRPRVSSPAQAKFKKANLSNIIKKQKTQKLLLGVLFNKTVTQCSYKKMCKLICF